MTVAIPGASLTCSYVITAAAAFSPANPALMSNSVEMLSRIRYDQRELFTQIAVRSREYFVAQTVLPTSAGLQNRTIDTTQLPPALERILLVVINGVTISQVDVLDQAAELAPRYYAQGTQLVEVNAEWGGTGAQLATISYCYGPNDIDPYGQSNQPLSVPDQWVDILVGNLAAYCALKDYGRPPTEIANAQALAQTRMQEFQTFLDQTAGVKSMRLDIPSPTPAPQ